MKKIKPIEQIADDLGLESKDLELYGKFKAKIPLENIKNNKEQPDEVTEDPIKE